MFDTPDLGPCCLAPFVALFAGLLVYAIGRAIRYLVERSTGEQCLWLRVLTMFLTIAAVPLVCMGSVILEIGAVDPAPWFQPADNDVIGSWELTPSTREFIRTLNIPVSTHKLTFMQDGTFRIVDAPSFWELWNPATRRWRANYISGSGIWWLGQKQGTQRLETVIYAQFREVGGRDDNHLVWFYFEGHLPPYTIVSYGSNLKFHFQRE